LAVGYRVERVVAVGASNLTRGLPTVVANARAAWGPDVQVLAALGIGRSYGAASRILARGIPSILDAGLWRALDERPETPTRALVTDVGNDIIYGFPVEQTLAWVAEVVARLQRHTRDIVLTDLPLHALRRLSPVKYRLLRQLLAPSSRLSLAETLTRAAQVTEGLEQLARNAELTWVNLKPDWYGFDPIHIRPSYWRTAWEEIMGCPLDGRQGACSLAETVRLYAMWPERQWLFGVECRTPQAGVALPRGGRVWLY
jgi:hypothetical protein